MLNVFFVFLFCLMLLHIFEIIFLKKHLDNINKTTFTSFKYFFYSKFVFLILISIVLYYVCIGINDIIIKALLVVLANLFFFICINIFYTFYLYQNAKNSFLNFEFIISKENVKIILFYFFPLNIILIVAEFCIGVYNGIL